MNEKKNRFRASAENFAKIPGSPIAYWVGENMFRVFQNPTVESLSLKVCKGCFTGNNERYLRWWHEVSLCDQVEIDRWHRYSKGGTFRRWYGNSQHVIFWDDKGKELKDYSKAGMGAAKYYGKEHIVWSGISTGLASFRLDDNEIYFDDVSPAVIFTGDVDFRMLCALNTTVIAELLKIVAPTMHFQAGDIKLLPICKSPCNEKCIELARSLITLSHSDWDEYETSWDFKVDPLVREGLQKNAGGMSLEVAWAAVFARRMEWAARMKELEEENNRLFIEAYGLEDELKPNVAWKDVSITGNPFYRYKVDAVEDAAGDTARSTNAPCQRVPPELETRARADAVRELISYGIGCLMGRYSLEQEGLILASQGETYQDYFTRVHGADKLRPDDDGIIPVVAGETAFTDNAPHRVVDFIKAAFGEEHLTENLNFVEATLGMTLEAYLAKEFWDDHKRMYKNRPIYWLFRSKKGAFQALVYMHRMDAYTATKVRNGYLLPHIEFLRGRIAAESARGAELTAKERTRLKKMQQAMEECLEYDGRLHVVADRMQGIDLDDGVAVNYAKFGDVLAKLK